MLAEVEVTRSHYLEFDSIVLDKCRHPEERDQTGGKTERHQAPARAGNSHAPRSLPAPVGKQEPAGHQTEEIVAEDNGGQRENRYKQPPPVWRANESLKQVERQWE